jgi:endoribonuclease Dicer
MHVYVKHPTKNEGALTMMRTQFENNKNFFEKALEYQIESYILSDPISRHSWIPPHFPSKKIQKISEKTIADVIEGIVGASYLSCGTNEACKTIRAFLGPNFEPSWEAYSEIWNNYITFGTKHPAIGQSMLSSISRVEKTIDYVFHNKAYMAQALVHSSFSGSFECYQRLEFLGDAVIGFLATRYLYGLSPDMDPGQLTKARSMLVCNQYLGCIALDLGLPSHMRHMNENLAQAVMVIYCNSGVHFGLREETIQPMLIFISISRSVLESA